MTTISALVVLGLVAVEPVPRRDELLKTFRDEFVHVTPGKNGFPAEFTMGREAGGDESQRPARRVTLKHDFHVARYEVPQNLWEAVMGDNPSRWKGPRNSVEMLTYDEAVRFCERATTLMREAKLIEPKQVVRLPSEAEWEYFARAGTTTLYSFGDDSKPLGDYAWFTGNAAGNDPPVGRKEAQPVEAVRRSRLSVGMVRDPWHDDYRSSADRRFGVAKRRRRQARGPPRRKLEGPGRKADQRLSP